jgi:hypothetical protein
MADNGKPQDGPIMCVPIVGAEQYLIADGNVAFILKAADGEQLAIRFAVTGLGQFRQMIWDAMVDAEQAKQPAGMFAFKTPQSYQVGHSDEFRNHVLLAFDPGSPGSANFMLADETALHMCEKIGEDVRRRNAPLAGGLALPVRRIIMPNGG